MIKLYLKGAVVSCFGLLKLVWRDGGNGGGEEGETSAGGQSSARGQFGDLYLSLRRSRGLLVGLPGLRVRKPFVFSRAGNLS